MKNLLNFLYYVFYIVCWGHDGIAMVILSGWLYFILINFALSIFIDYLFLSMFNFYVIVGFAIIFFAFCIYFYRGIERMDRIIKEYDKLKISRLKIHLIGYAIAFFPIIAFLLILYLHVKV
ncbi:hypothetical protein RCC89_19470 [Cytophagaceae bacterium ABcell3]|nr:hypothetical protein RCC89_19470 [Cytophagaceae bacterium ABcell3]